MTGRALITGVAGRAGPHSAESLQGKGYEVHGNKCRASSFNAQRIDHICGVQHGLDGRIHPLYGDQKESSNFTRIAAEDQPPEIYRPIPGHEGPGWRTRIKQKQMIEQRVAHDFAGATLEGLLAGHGNALSTAGGD